MLEDEAEACAVPSMVIQTLVENSVKHGLDSENGRTLHIRISAHRDHEHLFLKVEDDGCGIAYTDLSALNKTLEKDSADPGKSIGLSNVSQQLRLLFGDEAHIHLDGAPQNGFKVEIVIPVVQISDLIPS